MLTNKQKKICASILNYYTVDKQKMQCIQELSEMIEELTKRPDQRDYTYVHAVASEIADCIIMLEQMRIAFDIQEDDLQEAISIKLERQIDRMG